MEKVTSISITTNGLLKPSDEILLLLNKYHIKVDISNYDLNREIVENNYNLYKNNLINANYYDFCQGDSEWCYLGAQDLNREEKLEETMFRYRTCKFHGCLTLENGELSKCSRASNAWKIQGFERREEDYLVVEDKNDFANCIKMYINKTEYMNACRHCNGSETTIRVKAGEQIKN